MAGDLVNQEIPRVIPSNIDKSKRANLKRSKRINKDTVIREDSRLSGTAKRSKKKKYGPLFREGPFI